MSGFFHSLNLLRSFQKRFEREPTRVALQDNLIFLLSCPFFMMLQPFLILRKWNNDLLKKAVRTFFPSNCNFSGNIEPIIVFLFKAKISKPFREVSDKVNSVFHPGMVTRTLCFQLPEFILVFQALFFQIFIHFNIVLCTYLIFPKVDFAILLIQIVDRR